MKPRTTACISYLRLKVTDEVNKQNLFNFMYLGQHKLPQNDLMSPLLCSKFNLISVLETRILIVNTKATLKRSVK